MWFRAASVVDFAMQRALRSPVTFHGVWAGSSAEGGWDGTSVFGGCVLLHLGDSTGLSKLDGLTLAGAEEQTSDGRQDLKGDA